MSDMQSNHGIIKELYPELPSLRDKVQALAKELDKPLEDVIYDDKNEAWIELKDYKNYAIIGKRLFDISNAPSMYDEDDDQINIRKVGSHEYRIDLRYYNGGTCMEELVENWLEENDNQPVPSEFYAIKRNDGTYLTRAASAAPALYLSANKARATVESNFKHTASNGYKVVRFIEVQA